MKTRLLLALCVGVLGIATFSSAASASSPQLKLTETTGGTVLYGNPSTVTLSANNPSPALGGTPVYNTSFQDILPLGVSYVTGSSSFTGSGQASNPGDPTILVNQPATGETTLIWSNLGDLQPQSTESLAFKVQGEVDTTGTNPILPGESYTDSSGVYANTDPHYVPQFDPVTGIPVTGPTSYTDSDAASGTTHVVPLQVSVAGATDINGKTLRGVHDHQKQYTVTVHNNDVHNTSTVSATVYIPAGLEFLGCGGVDNTTSAATNPGSTQEYPGSGSLAKSTVGGCPTPASVTTVTNPTTQSGTSLSGVYTQVTWNLSDLTPGQVETFNYLVGIPLTQNAAWSGTPPADQAANLDNNTGAETYNGESLATTADVLGNYQGPTGGSIVNPYPSEGNFTIWRCPRPRAPDPLSPAR
jgi:uncharacterized repeat protein (TIGR01451 family)